VGIYCANSAVLIGAYMIYNLGMDADQVWRLFKQKSIRFMGYGDAARSQGISVITP
jgi:cell division cycle 14